MHPVPPSPPSERKAADADLLGEAVTLPLSGRSARSQAPTVPGVPVMPAPAPAEDENQPGFIGERNRPAP